MIASILLQLILIPVLLAAFAVVPQVNQPNHRPARVMVRVSRKKQDGSGYAQQSKIGELSQKDSQGLLII